MISFSLGAAGCMDEVGKQGGWSGAEVAALGGFLLQLQLMLLEAFGGHQCSRIIASFSLFTQRGAFPHRYWDARVCDWAIQARKEEVYCTRARLLCSSPGLGSCEYRIIHGWALPQTSPAASPSAFRCDPGALRGDGSRYFSLFPSTESTSNF